MNQTYTIEPIESQKSSREEFKQRLSQMRKRTRQMLDKHNWEKFFNQNGSLINQTTASSAYTESSLLANLMLNKNANSNQTESKLNLFNTSQSNISHNFDYDSILANDQIKLMPLLNNTNSTIITATTTQQITTTNTQKIKMFQTPVKKQRTLTRQQESLTFIADLVSTSTPTKKSPKPISSTPNVSTHDALKYHPKQTIRNKSKKQSSSKKVYKLNLECLKYDLKMVQTKLAKKTMKTRTLKRKLSSGSLASNDEFENQNCQNCKLCDEDRKKTSTVESKRPKLRLKGCDFEFSLQDLLYTPSKVVSRSVRGSAHAQASSKIYYL